MSMRGCATHCRCSCRRTAASRPRRNGSPCTRTPSSTGYAKPRRASVVPSMRSACTSNWPCSQASGWVPRSCGDLVKSSPVSLDITGLWYCGSCVGEGRARCGWSASLGLAVAAVAELVDEGGSGRLPAEFGLGLGRVGALVEQEYFGEVVTEPGPGLVVGTGDRAWCVRGDRGGRGQFGDGRVHAVADDVVPLGVVVFQ